MAKFRSVGFDSDGDDDDDDADSDDADSCILLEEIYVMHSPPKFSSASS